MNEVVRLETLDGTWEVGGVDRKRGHWPEDMVCVWDDWGAKTANFSLKREARAPQPDLSGLTPVVIEKAGGIWEGFVDDVTVVDEHTIGLACVGWQDYGSDDVERKAYVFADLTQFVDTRSILSADLAVFKQSGNVEVGASGITMGWQDQSSCTNNQRVGVTLDLGPTANAIRVSIDYEVINGNAAFTWRVRGHDSPYVLADLVDDAPLSFAMETMTSPNTSSGNFGYPHRYLSIYLQRDDGLNNNTAADHLVRVTGIRLYNVGAYASSNPTSGTTLGDASVLKASDVIKDALPRLCPQWSSDVSGIDATTLSLPHVASSDDRSFRELVDALNALHGYVRKLERGRRFRFKPQPILPFFTAGRWPGLSYRDTAKNATRDIVNKTIANGTNGAGEPIRSVRYAGQQPNVVGDLIFPFLNPGFETNNANWSVASSTITRDTGIFHSGVGSGKWDSSSALNPGDQLWTTFSSFTFQAQVAYRIRFWARTNSGTFPKAAQPFGCTIGFGVQAAQVGGVSDQARIYMPPLTTTWRQVELVWVPQSTIVNTAVFEFWISALDTQNGPLFFDDFTAEVNKPTLLDRRGRIRSKALSVPSQSVDPVVMEAFADIYLQSHMRTRARGELSVQGPALRLRNGKPVDPFEIGERTSELVCLLDELDPDTGALGRNVPIAQVSYNGNEESAQLSLDDAREDWEKIVGRYQLFAGGGV